jgi:hypothetical protein
MSWSIVARNCRHVHLHVKPVRAPVFRKVCLIAGRDLNSRKPSSCILSASVESAACVVSLVVSVVIKLDNVRHDDQLEQSSENVGTVVASESFHDPKKLGKLQKRIW